MIEYKCDLCGEGVDRPHTITYTYQYSIYKGKIRIDEEGEKHICEKCINEHPSGTLGIKLVIAKAFTNEMKKEII
jgi:hypothetical protein